MDNHLGILIAQFKQLIDRERQIIKREVLKNVAKRSNYRASDDCKPRRRTTWTPLAQKRRLRS